VLEEVLLESQDILMQNNSHQIVRQQRLEEVCSLFSLSPSLHATAASRTHRVYVCVRARERVTVQEECMGESKRKGCEGGEGATQLVFQTGLRVLSA